MKRRIKVKTLITVVVCSIVCMMVLVSCSAPSSSEQGKGDTATSTQAVEPWSMQSDCVSCHSVEAASMTNKALASTHAAQTCVDCHNDKATLEKAHEGVGPDDKMPKKLSKNSTITSDFCESCHSLGELAASTANSTVLTDSEGTVVNPHELPAEHLGNKLECTDCHTMHEETDATKDSKAACTSCHHENVYQCGTCHD